jgi:hypothetical protein
MSSESPIFEVPDEKPKIFESDSQQAPPDVLAELEKDATEQRESGRHLPLRIILGES